MAKGGLAALAAQAGFNTAPAPKKPASTSSTTARKVVALPTASADGTGAADDVTAALKPLGSLAALLAQPLEFVESTRSVAHLQPASAKYEACNVGPPKPSPVRLPAPTDDGGDAEEPHAPVASTSKAPPPHSLQPVSSSASSSRPVPLRWPSSRQKDLGPGFHNAGNTCYANAALQALVHTPAFATAVMDEGVHDATAPCPLRSKGFCALCTMRGLVERCLGTKDRSAFMPHQIVGNLRKLATHFRVGRQEDSHEFLRFLVDGMQNACLASMGLTSKSKPELRRQAAIHRIFGGRFRSRVTCLDCGANSDTFDDFLDLSLEVTSRTDHLRQAFEAFRRVDHLRGKNKYKCEACKREVNAEKAFSIDAAPPILTIHFKRFTPLGGKISVDVEYPEHISLGGIMSDDDETAAPTYTLHAVVCHSGSGPHSGHYYSFVRNAKGAWYRMDDSSVQGPLPRGKRDAQLRSAYMLFYTRQEDQLSSAIHAGLSSSNGHAFHPAKPTNSFRAPLAPSSSLLPGQHGAKRKLVDDDAELDRSSSPPGAKRAFIGPVRPGPSLREALPGPSSSPPITRLPPTSPPPPPRYSHGGGSSSSRPGTSSEQDFGYGAKYGFPSGPRGGGGGRNGAPTGTFYGQPQPKRGGGGGHHPQHYGKHNRPGGGFRKRW